MFRTIAACLAVWVIVSAEARAEGRPMALADLFALQRVADPQMSPDGRQVAYQLTTVDLAGNKSTTNLWLAAVDGKSPPRRLTSSTKSDRHPRWSPDGTRILFESTRSGENQLWVIDVGGGEARQLTTISTGAGSGIWSRDGKSIAFVSAVYPEYSEKPFAESDRLNKERLEKTEKGPVKARVFNRLFYRHWVEYVEDKRQHLFVLNADGGEPRDVTPGDRDAYPTSTTFSSSIDFTFTPDNKHLVFTAVPEKNEAWSTDYQLCRVSTDNRSPKWETLTEGNPAADSGPQFSPDGKRLAYRSQKRTGYEADRWDILIVNVNPDGTFVDTPKGTLKSLDASVNEFVWWGNEGIRFTADFNGKSAIFAGLDGFVAPGVEKLTGAYSSLSAGGGKLVAAHARIDRPAEVVVIDKIGDAVRKLSHANDDLLAKLDRPRPESVEVPVEGDVKMQMWVLKPPGFDATKKWPVVYLIHGGPQGAWADSWSFRWNPSLWAAQGYVVVMPNPRGSSGFGQKFMDEISGDWGGKCYRDLVSGLDHVEKLPYVDRDRIASAGASFGGYMMNWFAVNDIAPRFKTLITHCSVWNFESMWGTTDELWFDEWEHQGLPWEKPGKYAEFSPHKRAGELGRHKTPMLVIHNDLDFRCPIGQGHELFSALQRQKVPSRFVNFPDEGHWVLKPKNSEFWHQEVFGWLKKYCPPGPK